MLCKRWLNGDSKTQKVVVLARILHRQRTQNKRRKWNNKKWDDHLCSVFCHIIFQKRRSLGDWNGDKIYRHGLLQLFATSLRHGAQTKKSLQPRNKQTKCKEYNSDDICLKYLPCIYSGIYGIPESRLVEASILSQLLVRIDYKFRGSAGQKDNNKSKETIIVNKKCGIFVQRHAYENHRTKRFG